MRKCARRQQSGWRVCERDLFAEPAFAGALRRGPRRVDAPAKLDVISALAGVFAAGTSGVDEAV